MDLPDSQASRSPEVVILDQSEAVRLALASHFGEQTTVAHAGPGGLHDLVAAGRPVVVVLGPSFANDSALKLIEGSNLGALGYLVVLIAPTLDVNLMRSALEAGLREVISTDEVAARLVSVVEHLVGRLTTPVPAQGLPDEPSGEIIAVVGAKGGVGVTTIAVNLAVELAQQQRSVALIDADLQFGDVAVTLGLGRASTIRDALDVGPRLDPMTLRSMMTSHQSGVLVLPGSTDPSAADVTRSVDVANLIRCAARTVDVVIVDVPAGLSGLSLEILDTADRIALVVAPDVANLKNARLEIDILRKLHLAGKAKIVVNRVSPTNHASSRRIEHHLGLHIAGQINEAPDVRVAETTGVPFMLSPRRSHSARSFRAVCEDLVPTPGGPSERPRLATSRI